MLDLITAGLVGALVLISLYGIWRFRHTPSLFSLAEDTERLARWKTDMERRFSDHLIHYNNFQTDTYKNFEEINDKLTKINAGVVRVDEQYEWFKREWKDQKQEFAVLTRHFDEYGRLLNKVLATVGELQRNASHS